MTSAYYRCLPPDKRSRVEAGRSEGYQWTMAKVNEGKIDEAAEALKVLLDCKLYPTFDQKRELLRVLIADLPKIERQYKTLENVLKVMNSLLRSALPGKHAMIHDFDVDINCFLALLDDLYFNKQRDPRAPPAEVATQLHKLLPKLSNYWRDAEGVCDVLFKKFMPLADSDCRFSNEAWPLFAACLPVRRLSNANLLQLNDRASMAGWGVLLSLYMRLLEAHLLQSPLPKPVADVTPLLPLLYEKACLPSRSDAGKDWKTFALLASLARWEYQYMDESMPYVNLHIRRRGSGSPALFGVTKAVASLTRCNGVYTVEEISDHFDEYDEDRRQLPVSGDAENESLPDKKVDSFVKAFAGLVAPYCMNNLLVGEGGPLAGLLVQLDSGLLSDFVERVQHTESITSSKASFNPRFIKAVTPAILAHGTEAAKSWLLNRLQTYFKSSKKTAFEYVFNSVSFICTVGKLRSEEERAWGKAMFDSYVSVATASAVSCEDLNAFRFSSEMLLRAMAEESVEQCCQQMGTVIMTTLQDRSDDGDDNMMDCLSWLARSCARFNHAWGLNTAESLLLCLETELDDLSSARATPVAWHATFFARICNELSGNASTIERSLRLSEKLLRGDKNWHFKTGSDIASGTLQSVSPSLRVTTSCRPSEVVNMSSPNVDWTGQPTEADVQLYIDSYNRVFAALKQKVSELTISDVHVVEAMVLAFRPLIVAQRETDAFASVAGGVNVAGLQVSRDDVLDILLRCSKLQLTERTSIALARAVSGFLSDGKAIGSCVYYLHAGKTLRNMYRHVEAHVSHTPGATNGPGFCLPAPIAVVFAAHHWFKFLKNFESLQRRTASENQLLHSLIETSMVGSKSSSTASHLLHTLLAHNTFDDAAISLKCLGLAHEDGKPNTLTVKSGEFKTDEATISAVSSLLDCAPVSGSVWRSWAVLKGLMLYFVYGGNETTEAAKRKHVGAVTSILKRHIADELPADTPEAGLQELLTALTREKVYQEKALVCVALLSKRVTHARQIPSCVLERLLFNVEGDRREVANRSVAALNCFLYTTVPGLPRGGANKSLSFDERKRASSDQEQVSRIAVVIRDVCSEPWIRRAASVDKQNEYAKTEELRGGKTYFANFYAQMWKSLIYVAGDEFVSRIQSARIEAKEANAAAFCEILAGCLKSLQHRPSASAEEFVLSTLQSMDKMSSDLLLGEVGVALSYGSRSASGAFLQSLTQVFDTWLVQGRLRSVKGQKAAAMATAFVKGLRRGVDEHVVAIMKLLGTVERVTGELLPYEAVRTRLQKFCAVSLEKVYGSTSEVDAQSCVIAVYSASPDYKAELFLTSFGAIAVHPSSIARFLPAMTAALTEYVTVKKDYSGSKQFNLFTMWECFQAIAASDSPETLLSIVQCCRAIPSETMSTAKGQRLIEAITKLALFKCFTSLGAEAVFYEIDSLFWMQLCSSNTAAARAAGQCLSEIYAAILRPVHREALLKSYLAHAKDSSIKSRRGAATGLGGIAMSSLIAIPWGALEAVAKLTKDADVEVSRRAALCVATWEKHTKEKPSLWSTLVPVLQERGIYEDILTTQSSLMSQAFS